MYGTNRGEFPSSNRTLAHVALPQCEILLLVRNELTRRRITFAFNGICAVVSCVNIQEVRGILGARPVSALLTEAIDSSGVTTTALIQDVKRRFPRTTVLGCVSRKVSLNGASLALARAGVDDLLLEDELDLAVLVRRVTAAARLRCLVGALWPQIEPMLDTVLAPFVRFGLEHASAPLNVTMVAAALGAHRKTLWERCRSRGAPSPRELLSWCRVLAVTFALDDRGRTADSVAHELGFPTPSALRNLLQRYLGLTPTEVRAKGGSTYAVRRLGERLAMSASLRQAIALG
jgi:AraC-like DNA-binding protein